MNLYIEDINGNSYGFKKFSFSDNLKLQSQIVKFKDAEFNVQVEGTVKIFKEVFAKSNPDYNMELFDEEILEYNYQEIGLENLIALINMVIEEVFQSKGTNTNKYAFLQKSQA